MVVAYVAGIVLFILVVVGVFAAAHHGRVRPRHVAVEDGMLVTGRRAHASSRRFPVARIGTVVHIRRRPNPTRHGAGGLWMRGGLVILGRGGRVVRHVAYGEGLTTPLATVAAQIEGPAHHEYEGMTRSAFLAEYPGSLHFGQLWAPWQWVIALFIGIFGVLPALAVAFYVLMTLIGSLQGLA